MFYWVSVGLCLPKLPAAVQYVTCSCPIIRNLFDSYEDNNGFIGLGSTKDDI